MCSRLVKIVPLLKEMLALIATFPLLGLLVLQGLAVLTLTPPTNPST